jgi:hypothetical protein
MAVEPYRAHRPPVEAGPGLRGEEGGGDERGHGGHEWPDSYDRPVLDWLLALSADPTVRQEGARVVITYPSGTLQSATNVAGPWSEVEGAASPYSTLRFPSEGYFRTRL